MLKIKLFATLAIIVIACSTLATAASNQKIDKSLYSDIKSVIGERLNKIDNDNGNILVVFESGHYRTNDIIGWSAGYDSRLVFMQLAKRNNYNSVTCIATHSGSGIKYKGVKNVIAWFTLDKKTIKKTNWNIITFPTRLRSIANKYWIDSGFVGIYNNPIYST